MRDRRKQPAFAAKEKARLAVRLAIRKGTLVPLTSCELCGKSPGLSRIGRRLIRADHFRGYSRENYLTVQWVCPTCDGEQERLRRATL